MRSILLTLVAIFGLIAHSCIDDDFSDSPSLRLEFSTDTLSFGTVFTDLGSPTARLLVYNRNRKGVRISSVRFKDSGSPFSLNVDGTNGADFHDVEIRGGDSIYVFVECFVNADSDKEPKKISDMLEFVTNGPTQQVVVEAVAQNVERLRNVRIKTDTRLTDALPYVVFDSLTVENGATLTIPPGVRMLFHDGAKLVVEGTLLAEGSPERKIEMRGDRLDDVLPGTGYDLLAGQWGGVRISADSFGNRMECVDMRSSSAGLTVDSCGDLSRQKLTIVNSWLHNSSSRVLDCRHSKVDAYGCCFSDSPLAVVSLTGGDHRFVQCTIANQYLFSAVTEPNLRLDHIFKSGADGGAQLMKCAFENCIIWGLGAPLNEGDLEGSEVYMRNVLLRAEGADDSHFVDCIWNEDPLFLTERSEYYFNYHVRPDSPAIGRGNRAFVVPSALIDMDGEMRLPEPGSLPALGAYALPQTEPQTRR